MAEETRQERQARETRLIRASMMAMGPDRAAELFWQLAEELREAGLVGGLAREGRAAIETLGVDLEPVDDAQERMPV